MAFTDVQKAQIRMYLGFSEQFRDYDTRLESQMDLIGNKTDQSAHDNVVTLLTRLQNVDQQLENALGNQTLKTVEGGTAFQGIAEIQAYRNHGRNLVQRLAIVFDLEPKRDYYAESDGDMGGMVELG